MKVSCLNTILVLIFSFSILSLAQVGNSNLFSNENILKFANHLYAQEDYLRAVFEYRRYYENVPNDTISLKIAESYLKMHKYDESKMTFSKLFNSGLHTEAVLGFAKVEFLRENYAAFRETDILSQNKSGQILKLKYLSLLFTNLSLPPESEFLSFFPESSHKSLKEFYYRRVNPGYKSELKAALLSTIIPGAGKIYTGNYGDGITALIVTSVLGYISYDNFNAGHNIRGGIFAAIGSLFYAGNIYGSAASAQIHNAGIQLKFRQEFDLLLKNNNYFLSDD